MHLSLLRQDLESHLPRAIEEEIPPFGQWDRPFEQKPGIMSTTLLVSVGPTKVVSFPHLLARHGCSTRLGGVSPAPWDSLNTGFTVPDRAENVWENRRRFALCLEVDNLPWLLSMSHGTEVARVEEKIPMAQDLSSPNRPRFEADACITDRPGVPLNLTVADCVPVFFHDPVAHCVGLAHAGWRGTVGGIVTNTLKAMQRAYGSKPSDVLIGIGPSIGPEAFEVGPEVVEQFRAAFPDESVIRPLAGGKALIDLWKANTLMALRGGAVESKIAVSGWCTVSHPDLFFSYRRDRGVCGRLLAGIVL